MFCFQKEEKLLNISGVCQDMLVCKLHFQMAKSCQHMGCAHISGVNKCDYKNWYPIVYIVKYTNQLSCSWVVYSTCTPAYCCRLSILTFSSKWIYFSENIYYEGTVQIKKIIKLIYFAKYIKHKMLKVNI